MTLLGRARRATRGPGAVTVVVDVTSEAAAEVGTCEPERWAALARAVLEAEGVAGPAELALSFTGEAAMADLNRQWMGEDGPTDVLSFAIDAPCVAERAGAPAARQEQVPEPLLLGDVVVCPAVAARAAAATDRSFDDEVALLVVHGVLHVLGLDHADPAGEAAMQARELDHLTRFHDRRWTRTS